MANIQTNETTGVAEARYRGLGGTFPLGAVENGNPVVLVATWSRA